MNPAHDQLIERIANRYNQLEHELDQLEARLQQAERPEPIEEPAPRKPR